VRRDAYWESVLAAQKFGVQDDHVQINKPIDRGRWGITPPTSDAYYNPTLNEIVFPAGILQPPAFSMQVVDAVNYGAIGVVIGHEISHGFDDGACPTAGGQELVDRRRPEEIPGARPVRREAVRGYHRARRASQRQAGARREHRRSRRREDRVSRVKISASRPRRSMA
jgi:hypothetical protein